MATVRLPRHIKPAKSTRKFKVLPGVYVTRNGKRIPFTYNTPPHWMLRRVKKIKKALRRMQKASRRANFKK